MNQPNCCAILVAAGGSTRMGGKTSKQFLPLCGRPAIAYTLLAFEQARTISSLVVVAREEDFEEFRALFRALSLQKCPVLVQGGSTRQKSVAAGVAACPKAAVFFAVHDGARALILPQEVDAVVHDAFLHGASTLAAPVKDTIKFADGGGFVVSTPDRSLLWAVQTPQVFERMLYEKALRSAEREGADYTDDCQLVEKTGAKVHLCRGGYENLKLTTPEDLLFAEAVLRGRLTREETK